MRDSHVFARCLLGVAISERGATVSSVRRQEQSPRVEQTARFNLPAGQCFNSSILDVRQAGEALREFLRVEGFLKGPAWRRPAVVFGVPARWLWCRPITLPPADEPTVRQILWLHASERAADDFGPMLLDYLGTPSSEHSSTVTLLGLPQAQHDRLTSVASAAGLQTAAVLPTVAALHRCAARATDNA